MFQPPASLSPLPFSPIALEHFHSGEQLTPETTMKWTDDSVLESFFQFFAWFPPSIPQLFLLSTDYPKWQPLRSLHTIPEHPLDISSASIIPFQWLGGQAPGPAASPGGERSPVLEAASQRPAAACTWPGISAPCLQDTSKTHLLSSVFS